MLFTPFTHTTAGSAIVHVTGDVLRRYANGCAMFCRGRDKTSKRSQHDAEISTLSHAASPCLPTSMTTLFVIDGCYADTSDYFAVDTIVLRTAQC